MSRTRLTILGSGWGAFRLLKDVNPAKYDVTVVSPRNHMLFTPLLSSASVGSVNPRSICEPFQPHCAVKGARFVEAHAETVDMESRTVHCCSLKGENLFVPYDRLVLAVGTQAQSFQIPGVRRHALFMKETADAVALREAFLARLQEASCISKGPCHAEETEEVRKLLSVIVVGGGPSSIGLAAELRDFISRDVPRVYPHLSRYVSVHLVEWATSKLDPPSREDQPLRDYALARLSRKPGVQLHLGEAVAEVTRNELILKSGKTIPYGTLVWNAGTKPVPLVRNLQVAKTGDSGQLLTDQRMRVVGQQDIFAIGDCANVDDTWFPKNAHVANQQGAYLARHFNNDEVSDEAFQLKGLAHIGTKSQAQKMVPSRLRGIVAWLGWRSASWSTQLSFRNRLLVFGEYIVSTVFGRSLARYGQDSTSVPLESAKSYERGESQEQQWQDLPLAGNSVKGEAHIPNERLAGSIAWDLDDLGMRHMDEIFRMPPMVSGPDNSSRATI